MSLSSRFTKVRSTVLTLPNAWHDLTTAFGTLGLHTRAYSNYQPPKRAEEKAKEDSSFRAAFMIPNCTPD